MAILLIYLGEINANNVERELGVISKPVLSNKSAVNTKTVSSENENEWTYLNCINYIIV